MWYNQKYTTLLVTSIVLTAVAIMSLETGALWGSIIAGAISVALLLYAICKSTAYFISIKRLAKIYHEPRDLPEGVVYNSIPIKTLNQPQEVRVTIEFQANVRVRFMYISFQKGDIRPEIIGVYEWNEGENYQSRNIEIKQKADGAWHWNYWEPLQKRKREHIRIGIKCLAEKDCKGKLIIYLACAEGKKELKLPFVVGYTGLIYDQAKIKTEPN